MTDKPIRDFSEEVVVFLHDTYNFTNMSNITTVVVDAMQLAQGMAELEGYQKKAVVIKAVTQFVDDTDAMGSLEPVLLRLVPVMIDNLIAADRQKLILHPQVGTGVLACIGICKNGKKK